MTTRRADSRYARIADPTTRTVAGAHEERVSALERPDYTLAEPTFAIGPESTATNRVMVRVQLNYPDGGAYDAAAVVRAYLSSVQGGLVAATAPDTSVTLATTDGTILIEEKTRAAWTIETTAAGLFALNIVNTTAADFWLNVLWYGRKFSSTVIRFT